MRRPHNEEEALNSFQQAVDELIDNQAWGRTELEEYLEDLIEDAEIDGRL